MENLKLRHPRFGEGTVVERKGMNVLVDFGAEIGVKNLLVKYANLKNLDGTDYCKEEEKYPKGYLDEHKGMYSVTMKLQRTIYQGGDPGMPEYSDYEWHGKVEANNVVESYKKACERIEAIEGIYGCIFPPIEEVDKFSSNFIG